MPPVKITHFNHTRMYMIMHMWNATRVDQTLPSYENGWTCMIVHVWNATLHSDENIWTCMIMQCHSEEHIHHSDENVWICIIVHVGNTTRVEHTLHSDDNVWTCIIVHVCNATRVEHTLHSDENVWTCRWGSEAVSTSLTMIDWQAQPELYQSRSPYRPMVSLQQGKCTDLGPSIVLVLPERVVLVFWKFVRWPALSKLVRFTIVSFTFTWVKTPPFYMIHLKPLPMINTVKESLKIVSQMFLFFTT
jgi:hypothetical protein